MVILTNGFLHIMVGDLDDIAVCSQLVVGRQAILVITLQKVVVVSCCPVKLV